MTRLVEVYRNGRSIARELAYYESHEIDGAASIVRSGDLTRFVTLDQLAQIFVDGAEVWRNPEAEIAKVIEQGRVHEVVASDGVGVRDRLG